MPVLVRSPSSWLRCRLGGIVFALVATAGAAACGGIGITSESSGGDNGSAASGGSDPVEDTGSPGASANFDASTGAGDAGNGGITLSPDTGVEAPDTEPYISPLCGTVSACDPDLVTGNGCGAGVTDGGASHGVDAGYGGPVDGSAALACRVSVSGKTSAMLTASACVAGGAGTDGYACTGGDDCSTGYECVGTPGQCRRYCCSGACSDDKAFCDVQPATAMSGITVPVCMPVANCKLLDSTFCGAGETCSVVADDGTTSCVATGPASEGEPCDTVHCMANEICVGKSGSRVCDKLCNVGQSDCTGGKVCTTNATLFAGTPDVGVCAPQ